MTTNHAGILDDLAARGLLHDTTDRGELAELLSRPITLYHGIDPSADSLHVGNFVGVLALRRFQDFGHRPIVLVGGATGMVGDPSGRSDERNLLDADTLAGNVHGIRSQLERFLDFGDGGATLVNNRDWTGSVTVLEFLRDVGKHITVNQMVAKESVRSRMEGEHGISYTEFSYMLLQSFDYWWLHENMDCRLQVGGSDQWGNITAGIDFIRRRSGASAYGVTWPLITRADGSKFGKSQDDSVWLSAERTSPYRFYQYWVNTDDRDLERFLFQLTLLPVHRVAEALADHEGDPGLRRGQHLLAREITTLVHDQAAATGAAEASELLFGGEAGENAFATLVDEVPTTRVAIAALGGEGALVDLLTESGMCKSKGDARRAISERSIYVNNERREDDSVTAADLRHERFLLLRRGKKNYNLVICR